MIEDGISKAMALTRNEILNPSKQNTDGGQHIDKQNDTTFCVTTYDPNIKHPSMQIRDKVSDYNDCKLAKNQDKDIINIKYSFRKNPSLKQLLMFKKSPQNFGVFKCSDNCTLCANNLFAGPELVLKTGVIVRPNARFECITRNVLYIIVCLGCLEYYLGQTGDETRNRFTVHRQHMKLDYKDAPVKADPHIRICGKGKYLVFPFYKPKINTQIYREQQEKRWIKILKPKLNNLV